MASSIPEREPYYPLASGPQSCIYTSLAKVICLGCIARVFEVAFSVITTNGSMRPIECLKQLLPRVRGNFA
jgi:hypothetical protein